MYFILSYFNQIFGPQVYDSIPEGLPDKLREHILKYMNINIDEGFLEGFTPDQKFKIINYVFEIPSELARGKLEIIMLSLCVEKNYKFEMFQENLKEFGNKLKRIPHLYKIFHKEEHSGESEIQELLTIIKKNLSDNYKKVERIIENPNLGIFLTLGLSKAGKSTILNYLKTNAFKDMKPTLALEVIKMMIDKKIFRTIDVSGQKKLRSQWWTYTKNPDAIIFVIDINDPLERLKEAKYEFSKIGERISHKIYDITDKIPLLICLNKIDLADKLEQKYSEIIEMLDLKNSKINYKVQLTSAKDGTGIIEGFKWIFQELLELA
jgi:small GTP-binding protein